MARTLPIVWKTLPLSYIPSLFRFLSFPLSSLNAIPLFFCPFLKQGLTIVSRQASNSDPTPASGFWVAGIIGVSHRTRCCLRPAQRNWWGKLKTWK